MKYKITIPEPCHEDWSKMTPQEKGRFCDKCEKCVIDFTGLSTQQMFNHINAGKDLCGRFRPDQLNRDLVAAPVKKGFSFQWALSSVIAFTGFTKAFGQSEEYFPVGRLAYSETTASPKSLNSQLVYGSVFDSETGEPIAHANVSCKEVDLFIKSDFDGNFSFNVDSAILKQGLWLEIGGLGYETVKSNVLSSKQKLEIYLHLRPEVIVPVIIKSDTLTISGTITDSRTGESIPFANVVCRELALGCASDFDGKFTLKLPAHRVTDSTKLVVDYLGYIEVVILVKKENKMQSLDIKLQENPEIMGEVTIVKDSPWNRFKSWFR